MSMGKKHNQQGPIVVKRALTLVVTGLLLFVFILFLFFCGGVRMELGLMHTCMEP